MTNRDIIFGKIAQGLGVRPDDPARAKVVSDRMAKHDRHPTPGRVAGKSTDALLKKVVAEKKMFPGYLLVRCHLDDDSWYVIRNTPGVTGFVGMGNTPTPLRPEEVAGIIKRMEAEAPKVKVTFKTGQKVRIIDGPFNDFIGTVSEIDMDRTKVRVMVSFFGRETPVELDFLQVEKV